MKRLTKQESRILTIMNENSAFDAVSLSKLIPDISITDIAKILIKIKKKGYIK